jgi:hypothetical protein
MSQHRSAGSCFALSKLSSNTVRPVKSSLEVPPSNAAPPAAFATDPFLISTSRLQAPEKNDCVAPNPRSCEARDPSQY